MRVDLSACIYSKIRDQGYVTYAEIDAEIFSLYTSAALLRAGATKSQASFAKRYKQCLPVTEEEKIRLMKIGIKQTRNQFVYARTRGTHPIVCHIGDRLCFTEVGLKAFGQKS